MPLSSGTRVGPYEILSTLGAGAMGVVYRARDSRLGRDVAIKVLPDALTNDPDRLRRFEHEARATGALNHPNVLVVLDVGRHEGAPFIVSELVEGETLRERLRSAGLPYAKAVECAIQIARGLAAAHEKGIVHRDIKPENVFLTNDGRVKLLDFGLAKLQRDVAAGSGAATESTASGVVLGTASYMSPEQVRGRPADHRSDIFSLGIVLYELLSRQRPFRGETSAEMMTAILKEEPAPLEATSGGGAAVDRIMRRCLEKNPAERFQSARDLAFALEATSAPPAGAGPAGPARLWPRLLAPLLAAAMCLLALVVVYQGRARSGGLPSFQRLTFRRGIVSSARLTPDGGTVVYSASWEGGGPPRVYSKPLEGRDASLLELPEAEVLAVSAASDVLLQRRTSRSLAANLRPPGMLVRAPLAGGSGRDLIDGVTAADWSPDGNALAVARIVHGETRLELPLGKVLYATSDHIGALRFSPQGDRIALAADNGDDGTRIDVVDLAGNRVTLSRGWHFRNAEVAWAPSGREVWFTALHTGWTASLRAVTLAGREREVLKLPAPLQLQDIARDGRVLLATTEVRAEMFGGAAGQAEERNLSWFESSNPLSLSADGRKLLFAETAAGDDGGNPLYIRGTDGSPAVRIGSGFPAALSPDALRVAACPLGPPFERVRMIPTGVGESRWRSLGSVACRSVGWLFDNRRLLVQGEQPGQEQRTYVVEESAGEPRAVTPPGVVCGGLSPDSGSLACQDGAGKAALYPVAGGTPRPLHDLEQGETIGGWSADGKSLIVANWDTLPLQVFLVDLGSGHRRLWRTFQPADMTGVRSSLAVVIADDLKTYVYRYRRILSNLYLVDGLT